MLDERSGAGHLRDATVVRWPGAAAFLERADEARHTVAYGSALTLLGQSAATTVSPVAPFFATVEDGGRVVATAIRQPPYGLVVSPAARLVESAPNPA